MSEAIAAGVVINTLFVEAPIPVSVSEVVEAIPSGRTTVLEVSPSIMKLISGATTPPGILAIASFLDLEAEQILSERPSFSLVLADVRDPGNAGTILRTAWATGVEAVFVGKGSVDVYNSKVVRSAAGGLFNVSVARDVDIAWLLDRLRTQGVKTVGTDSRAAMSYDEVDMREPVALIFGNEANGLPPELIASVDETAAIPLAGSAESLNVGIAAALFMFEVVRQRRSG